jgi:hypothetical protein
MARGREARTTEETLYYGRDNLYSEGFFFVIVREERITGLLARVLFFSWGSFVLGGSSFSCRKLFFFSFFFLIWDRGLDGKGWAFFSVFFFYPAALEIWAFSCLRTGFSTNFFFSFRCGRWRNLEVFFFSFSDSFSLSWGFEGEKCITKPQVKS